MAAPGWPVILTDPHSGVVLRPYQRGDARAWSRCRVANEAWLSVWEPTPPTTNWADLNWSSGQHAEFDYPRNLASPHERD